VTALHSAGRSGCSTPAPIGVGVIGCGRIGRVHAAGITRVARARLVGVADPAHDLARCLAAELGVGWSASPLELLDAPGVDAVVIASPSSTHSGLVVAACERGKHVLCEKPLGLNGTEAAAAAHAARAGGVILQTGFMLRFDPDLVRLHEAIGDGELGTVDVFHACLRDKAPPSEEYLRACGGLVADATIHLLDLALWLVGPIAGVSGAWAQMQRGVAAGGPDLTAITLRFESGALGVLENARAARYGAECRVEVVGTKGAALFERNRAGHTAWRRCGRTTHELGANFVSLFAEAYQDELRAFVASATGRDRCRADADAGVLASQLSDAARRALETGTVVSIESGQKQ
jgi:predicted dehydrogenase